MLVDLNKEEINYLVNVLNLNNSEIMNKEETNFSSNLYLKLRNLSTVCTCKEANS
jgi:DNA-directed RNA polymerase